MSVLFFQDEILQGSYLPVYTWAFLVAQMLKNLTAMQETQVQSLGQEDPPLQDSYLENSVDRRAWQAKVYGVAKS